MLQFYFLSVFLNGLAGFILFSKVDEGDLEFKSGFSLKDDTFCFTVGVLSVITAFLKILSAIEGDVRVIGDIIPAITGFLAGLILIFEHYRGRMTADENGQSEKIDRILVHNKRIIGIAAIIAAALHFLFPTVPLI